MFKLEDLKLKREKNIERNIQLLKHNDNKKYILGINEYSDKILEWVDKECINIDGIIDDFTKENHYKNRKVFKLHEIEEDSLVINCVIDGKLVDINEMLEGQNIENIINYCDLVYIDEWFNTGYLYNFRDDIEKNIEKYEIIYSKLEDEKSQKCYEDITNFRYNMDYNFLRDYKVELDRQYFEDFINIIQCDKFIDCGAFDGQTSIDFAKYNPLYKKIYMFEPSKISYLKCKNNLLRYTNIDIFNNGVYSENINVKFTLEKGSANKIDKEGIEIIKCVKMDDVITEEIDFIKMDVEGSEYEALLGCKNIIQKNKPKLAVCVYHKQEHFWKIPELILSYNKDYKIYIRHYTRGLLETVMYFV